MTAVAIDGPAGAGKSTVARGVAEALGFTYVDTGAMYRAVAFIAQERGVDPGDAIAVQGVATVVDVSLEDGAVMVEGKDVTRSLRTEAVSRAAAEVARHQGVRAALVALQRRLAGEGDVVMEGRDIGTMVLPDADVKVFLTASLEERTGRRANDLGVTGSDELDELRKTIAARDRSDMHRAESPLVQAPDAVVVDSTDKTVTDVVHEIVRLVRGAQG